MRQRETLLNREKKKLDIEIQHLNNDKSHYENQIKSKNSRFQKLDIETLKYECQKELLTFDKEVFFIMNSIINSYNFVANHQNEIIIMDNSSGINNNSSSSKKKNLLIGFTPLFENKNKKLFRRYNTDHNMTVYKTNLKINNLNNISVLESTDFSLIRRKYF